VSPRPSTPQQRACPSVVPIESTIPPDMTIQDWRRSRPARRRHARCGHLHDTTTRYDHARKLLTFLLVCRVCNTEKVIEVQHYEPRFQALPANGRAPATVHHLPNRRGAQVTRRAA
jgi:hypothetical protein